MINLRCPDARGPPSASPLDCHVQERGSWTGSVIDVHTTVADSTGTPAVASPALTLDRVIGQTCLHNSALVINPITGDVAYPAGCVVVIYQPRRNRQSRYFRAAKAVSCLAFSRDGGMLAVGERGIQPSVTVWNLSTGRILREVAGGHRFGIACVLFTPSGGGLVTMGFRHDRMLKIWDLHLSPEHMTSPPPAGSPSPTLGDPPNPDTPPPPPSVSKCASARARPTTRNERAARQVASIRVPQRVRCMDFTSDSECLVTCGDRHVKFWSLRDDKGSGGFMAVGSDVIERDAASPGRGSDAGASAARSSPPHPCTGTREDTYETACWTLEGWSATLAEELEEATFVDIASDKGPKDAGELDSVYGVTSAGILCAFTR